LMRFLIALEFRHLWLEGFISSNPFYVGIVLRFTAS
jgi:hypothetical protein